MSDPFPGPTEVLPGVPRWTAFHDGIRERVISHYVEPAGALIDPMVPEEGLGGSTDACAHSRRSSPTTATGAKEIGSQPSLAA